MKTMNAWIMDSAKQWFEKTLSKDHRADEIKEILFNSKDADKHMIDKSKIKESIDINK